MIVITKKLFRNLFRFDDFFVCYLLRRALFFESLKGRLKGYLIRFLYLLK